MLEQPELTVVTFWWQGWRNVYHQWHVHALQHMLKQHLPIPHRFVCVTDRPTGLRCETRPIWNDPVVRTAKDRPNCYRRLKLFSDEAQSMFGPRVLSIDLDTVIYGDISHLITEDDLKCVKGKASPINGSMWLHTTGTRTDIWNKFDPAKSPDMVQRHARATNTKYTGSDQAWISYRAGDIPTWGPEDGVYHFSLLKNNPLPANTRIVFFAGSQKPWSVKCLIEQPALYEAYKQALLATDFENV